MVILVLFVSIEKESIVVDMLTVYVTIPFSTDGGRHVTMSVVDEVTGEVTVKSLT